MAPKSLVNPWIKWLLFSCNWVFWALSLLLIGVGIWAFIATQTVNTNNGTSSDSKDLFDYLFDFSLLFIVFGVLMFLWSLVGMLGALRENICLLKTFSICLLVLFLLEFITAIAVLALSGHTKSVLEGILQEQAIEDYRDADINRRNVIDWFQETFECCGVGEDGYRDWIANRYFNCESPGFEACSVPYSCCKEEFRYKYDTMLAYARCGRNMLNKNVSKADASRVIFVRGCIDAAIESAKDNTLLVGGVALAAILPQLLGIALSWMLARQVRDQSASFNRR